MIVFEGELSKESRDLIFHGHRKNQLIGTIVAIVLILIPAGLIATFAFDLPKIFMLVAVLFLAGLTVVLAILPPPKGDYAQYFPTKVTISKDGIITADSSRNHWESHTDLITKVNDSGTCYFLTTRYDGKIFGPFACEKALLKEGTLEEFETLFEGKITKINP